MSRIQCEFEGGVLTLRGRLRSHRFRWEPAPLAEELDARGRWREAWPLIRLFSPKSGGPPPVAAFRDTLPPGLVASVERFPRHQWSLLALLHAEACARDLARDCPVLAFCVANSHIFRGGTPGIAAELARRHCRQPRREIAGWLGFPAAESTVRVLARILPEAVVPEALLGLRTALIERPGLAKLLQHLPSINAGVLFFASRWRLDGLPTSRLLAEIAGDPEERDAAPTGSLLIDALRLVAEIDPNRRIPAFHSADRVRRFHEEAVRENREVLARRARERAAEERRRAAEERRRVAEAEEARRVIARGNLVEAGRRREALDRAIRATFPSPPLPGTDSILPLATMDDLERESAEQTNCVATMAPDAASGSAYFYRVLAPTRATVEIRKGGDRRWRLAQLKGPRNRPAPPATRKAVERWLDGAQR